jgi:DNA polymerase I-like protein with 3'-5' exonuclease and polymerase domains
VTDQGPVLFVDVETIGTNPRLPTSELLMTGWRFQDERGMDIGQPGKVLADRLMDRRIVKASHTIYDAAWLKHDGTWHDTRVMAWCVNENTPLDLAWLLQKYCGLEMDKRLNASENKVVFTDDRGVKWDLALYHEWDKRVQQEFIDYCIRDVDALAMLYGALGRGLIETEQLSYWLEEEVPFTNICIEMERNGLPIDLDATATLATEVVELRDKAAEHLHHLGRLPDDFNLNSPDQLSEYLFNKWFQVKGTHTLTDEQRAELKGVKKGDRVAYVKDEGWVPGNFEVGKVGRLYIHGMWVLRGRGLSPTPPTKRKLPNGEVVEGKHPSTATPELLYKHGRDPWVRELTLTFRRTDKLLGTYLEKFPRVAVVTAPDGVAVLGDNRGLMDGAATPDRTVAVTTRIHGRYNQGGTVTGRLSSSDPNLQNIPSRHELGDRVRELFRGRFIIGDYDALEMRLMAHWSGDPELIRIFERGLDPHVRTAYAIFGVEVGHDDPRRGMGKTINYGVGYGAGPKKLAQVLSVEGYPTSTADAKGYLNVVSGFYKVFFRWGDRTKWQAKEYGHVETLSGRTRHLKGSFEDLASWNAWQYGERQAVNSVIQGSAADVIRRGMLAVSKQVLPIRTLAQIHDEAIWEYVAGHPLSEQQLKVLQWCMEKGHGYNLRVPLTFQPYVCDTWAQKGEGSAIEMLEEEARKT